MNNIGNRKMQPAYRTIFITGASSGIGYALAYYYAQPGITLVLWGRNEPRLKKVAGLCSKKGALVYTRSVDITEIDEIIAYYKQDDTQFNIDLAILSAGISDIKKPGDMSENPKQVFQIGMVNYAATSAMATIAGACMAERKKGHIVIVSSVAAFHALPFAAAYSGSKAGLNQFAAALRIHLKKYGVFVTLVCPGFVDTPMSQRVKSFKPGLITVGQAAQIIGKAIEERQRESIFPKFFIFLKYIEYYLPVKFRDFILSHIPSE